MLVRLHLFKAYCSSLYGSTLWLLSSNDLEVLAASWRKSLRRILHLPFRTHCDLLPVVSDSLPFIDEMCKRSIRFAVSCITSQSNLVKTVSRHCIVYAKYGSTFGSNVLFCCQRYGWSIDSVLSNSIQLGDCGFKKFHYSGLTEAAVNSSFLLLELMLIREGYFTVSSLSHTEIDELIELCAV